MKKYIISFLILAVLVSWTSAYDLTKCEAQNCQICSQLGICVMCQPTHVLTINKETKTSNCVERACQVKNCVRCITEKVCAQC